MIRRSNGEAYECVVIDLNTQRDFCATRGACPVVNLSQLIPALRSIFAWAKWNCVPVVSAIDSHRLGDVSLDGRPPHCVDGTTGQKKIDFTVFATCARVEFDNTLSAPLDIFSNHQQVVFRERTDDLFSNPKADRFLTQLPAQEFIVIGNPLERSVKAVALGLRSRERKVTVVPDACGYWSKGSAELAVRQMIAKGANLAALTELITRRLRRHCRYRLAAEALSKPNTKKLDGKTSGIGRVAVRAAKLNGNGRKAQFRNDGIRRSKT
ncbi:MAG: isochorismatase family protein [Phycisphaerales bacterium]|nr:MAG: isochorismatase family protein [Phycisphaerales bacterium]